MGAGSISLAASDGVCPQHIEDDFLRQFVKGGIDGQTWTCAICGQDGSAVADVVEVVVDAVDKFFERANDAGVPFDEGDWVFPVIDTWDMLMDLGIESSSSLFEAIEQKLGDDAWVPVGARFPNAEQLLDAGWVAFCDRVKHRSRFLFETTETDEYFGEIEQLGTLKFLDELLGAVIVLQRPRILQLGDVVFRARALGEPGQYPRSVKEYTSPPQVFASQGRMNPAGISYFYGSLEASTAAVEVHDGRDFAAVASFNPVRELELIDLTDVTIPSVFNSLVPLQLHQQARFLRNFASEISRPFIRDDRIHQEYVPTQAFTEYVRFRMDPQVDGIAFSSARCEGTNVVLFADQSQCLGGAERTAMLAPQATISIIEYGTPPTAVLGSRDLNEA
jgi:hypothetical protein